MIVLLVFLMMTRKDFETTILRQRGSTYQTTSGGRISNIFEINLTNKTQVDYKIKLQVENSEATIDLAVKDITLPKEGRLKERFVMKLPMKDIHNGKEIITVLILGNGEEIQRVKVKFIGPLL